MRARILFCLLAISAMAALIAPIAAADVLYACEMLGSGDRIDRGFYIPNYKGLTLGTVTLVYTVDSTGVYTTSLTAHAGTFDGPVIGTAEVTFNEAGGEVTYDFHDAAVTEGETIAFVQSPVTVPVNSVLFFGVGPCTDEPCDLCGGLIETEDTTPPLSYFRRSSVSATVVGRASTPVEKRSWGEVKTLYR